MKAIIVDDEKHVREGLLLLAEWERFGIETILEAADGNEAIKLITEHQPEIIFTDMSMPRCDGIDLLKWIHTSKLKAKTIVVSGYDDFKYTKNAITYGGFDYILKPINPVELNETLSRAVTEWNEQNRNRLFKLENDKVILDHLLTNNLSKANLSNQVLEQISKEKQTFENYTIAIIPMKMMINKKYLGDIDRAFTLILSICNSSLDQTDKGIAFRNMNNEEELVLLVWNFNDSRKVIDQIVTEIKYATEVCCPIVVGLSSEMIMHSYDSASQNLAKLNLLSEENSFIESDQGDLVYLFDYTEDIKWAIQSGSLDQMDRILDRIFLLISERKHFTFEQLEIWEKQFEILKEHWLKEYEISRLDSFYKGVNYWNDKGSFSFTRFQEEKKREFHELIKILYDVKFQKEKNTVQMIEEYIRNNYQKDIKLQDIADRFFLSREHISRRFKNECHETITDYVTKIRIEKAKELLENPFLKIFEIAEAVGYQNDKYFIKVFKKIEGLTPKEYRNSMQRD